MRIRRVPEATRTSTPFGGPRRRGRAARRRYTRAARLVFSRRVAVRRRAAKPRDGSRPRVAARGLWHVVAGRLARAARLHVVQNPVRSDHPSCQSHQHQAGALPGAMPKLQGDQRASKPLAGRRRESG